MLAGVGGDKAISAHSYYVRIAEGLIAQIESGALCPGEQLPPERELTQMFGVGRSTLREAISALVLVGYLEVVQGRGTFLKNENRQDCVGGWG